MIIKCFECNIEFNKHRARSSNDGLFRCKSCNKQLNSKRYNTSDKGKTARRAADRRWRIKHKDLNRAKAKKWAKENSERRKEIDKRYAQTDKGRARSKRSRIKYYWADPEYQRKRGTAARHGVTPDFITELRERQPHCQLCGTRNDLTVDHMNPVSNGGKAIEGNVQSLCGRCNSWKCDRLFLADGSGYLVGS